MFQCIKCPVIGKRNGKSIYTSHLKGEMTTLETRRKVYTVDEFGNPTAIGFEIVKEAKLCTFHASLFQGATS